MNATTVRAIFDILSVTSVLVLLVMGMAVIVGMMKVFNMCYKLEKLQLRICNVVCASVIHAPRA